MGEAGSSRAGGGACGGNVKKTRYRGESRNPGRSLEQTPSLHLGMVVCSPPSPAAGGNRAPLSHFSFLADALHPSDTLVPLMLPQSKGLTFAVSLSCRIEEELGDEARFAGHNFRNPSVL